MLIVLGPHSFKSEQTVNAASLRIFIHKSAQHSLIARNADAEVFAHILSLARTAL